jgi:hypothetical protein
VLRAGISFDLTFGLGAKYPTGEEIIFLIDAYRAGLDIRFMPVPIVIHPKESSGSNLYKNDPLIKAKGAMFARIFGHLAAFHCAAFAVKHHKKSGYSLPGVLRRILGGYFEYLRDRGATGAVQI